MIRKITKYLLLFFIFTNSIFASAGSKSHSAEMLSRGRYIPIAISDDFLVTAKTFSSLSSRSVDIYELYSGIDSMEKTAELNSPNPLSGDDFGFSMAIHKNYLLIGAPGSENGNGVVYLYRKGSSGDWIVVKTFENPNATTDPSQSQKFGYNVALNDKYIAISSPFFNDGTVFIYDFNPESENFNNARTIPFKEVDVRKLGDVEGCYAAGPEKFGFGVTMSFNNNKLLIGSLKEFVHLVEFKNGLTFGTNILSPEEEGQNDNLNIRFGQSVYVGDSSVYISALNESNGQGKVYVYPYIDTNNKTDDNPWTNFYTIQPTDLIENSYFGYRFSELDNQLIISTFNQSNLYVFNKNELNNKFILSEVIDNNNYDNSHYFGRNVVLIDDALITDAYYADELVLYNNLSSNRQSFQNLSTKGPVLSINSKVECTGGTAGSYQCKDIDLMAFMDKTDIGGGNTTSLNDIWGWTDSVTNKEYAIVGMSNGTSFVDVTSPDNPIYIGRLATHSSNSTWRDIKVYNNHAFIVSEASGHGMQVFDLTILRTFNNSPITFSETAHYAEFGNAHNIFINEDTGFAYAIGTSTCGPGGLHIVDISTPTLPSKSACVSDPATGRSNTGYVHDVQCVVYNGPDSQYVGKEICFGSNETNVWIADLSTKSDDSSGAKTIGLGSYDDYYTHQGWLTEDHKYFIVNDELDEYNGGFGNTRTLIWNVEDLSNPTLQTTYTGPTPSIDHNNYVIGSNVYMSHYTSGLRILDISDINNPSEKAYFDVYPSNNNSSFDGTWSNYPYYNSGTVVVTGIDEGLYILNPTFDDTAPDAPTNISYEIPEDGTVSFNWTLSEDTSSQVRIYRSEEALFTPSSSNLIATVNYPISEFIDENLDTTKIYYYKLSSVNSDGEESQFSSEYQIQPVTFINAPPNIDTVSDVQINEDTNLGIQLTGVNYGADVNAQNVTVTAYAENTAIFPSLVVNNPSTGQFILDLSPSADSNGSSVVYVTVRDDGGTADGGIDSTRVSFNATILPVNDSPGSFTASGEYLFNAIDGSGAFLSNEYLFITPENQNDSLRFVWEESADVDGDTIEYRMIGYDDLEFLSMNTWTQDTSMAWALKDLVAQTDTVNVSEGSWSVISTDGQSFQQAISGSIGNLKIDGRALIPDMLELKQNYPNPFTTFTTLEYDVPSPQYVVLRVFNIKGQLVTTLVDEEQGAGYKSVVWDGTNDNGDTVSSGVYFCQMYTPANPNGGQFIKAIKMLRLR
ncbi:MAG: choice-of-anchor B family protein [Candidatus Neomarinimicrobiota bacterium]